MQCGPEKELEVLLYVVVLKDLNDERLREGERGVKRDGAFLLHKKGCR